MPPHIIDLILTEARRRPGKDRVENIETLFIEIWSELIEIIGNYEREEERDERKTNNI